MRVLITGSRFWDNKEIIRTELTKLGLNHTLVSGNCPQGADLLCENVAKSLGWNLELYPADWNKYGKSAGFQRNKIMVNLPPVANLCLAFIKNKSKGASMTARLAYQEGIPLKVFLQNSFSSQSQVLIKKYNILPDEKSEDNNSNSLFLF